MEKVQATGNGIVFQFLDKVKDGVFGSETESGIVIPPSHTNDSTGATAVVISIGDKVQHVKIFDRIIIEHLMWTTGFEVDGETFWKTDESKVLAILD